MNSSLVCPNCKGAIQVNYRRVHRPVEGTKFEEMRIYPEPGSADEGNLLKVFPDEAVAGFRMTAEWKIDEAGKRYVSVHLAPTGHGIPTSPSADPFEKLTREQLLEECAKASIKGVSNQWNREKCLKELRAAAVAV